MAKREFADDVVTSGCMGAVQEALQAFYESMKKSGWFVPNLSYGTHTVTDSRRHGRKTGHGRVYGFHVSLQEVFAKKAKGDNDEQEA